MTWQVGDINGDNRADLVYMHEGQWHYTLSQPNGAGYINERKPLGIYGDRESNRLQLADYNLDGRLDLYILSSNTSINVYLNLGYSASNSLQSFSTEPIVADFNMNLHLTPPREGSNVTGRSLFVDVEDWNNLAESYRLMDINGDGYQDVILKIKEQMYITNARGNTIENDNATRILLFDKDAKEYVEGSKRYASTFLKSAVFTDVNSDGNVDFVYRDDKYSVDWDEDYLVELSLGDKNGFTMTAPQNIGQMLTSEPIRFFDHNADGVLDIIYFENTSECDGSDCASVNVGDVAPNRWNLKYGSVDPDNGSVNYSFVEEDYQFPMYMSDKAGLLDVNGDGFLDLFNFENGDIVYYERLFKPRKVINKITDGNLSNSYIRYSSLNNRKIHTRSESTNEPTSLLIDNSILTDVIYPQPVVSFYKNSSDLISYRYHGGKTMFGRGFIGFESVIATNQTTSIETRVNYRQDFPLVGNVIKNESFYLEVSSNSQNCDIGTIMELTEEETIYEQCTPDVDQSYTKLSSSIENYEYVKTSAETFHILNKSSTVQNWSFDTGELLVTKTKAIASYDSQQQFTNELGGDLSEYSLILDSFGNAKTTVELTEDHINDFIAKKVTKYTFDDTILDWGSRIESKEIGTTRDDLDTSSIVFRKQSYEYESENPSIVNAKIHEPDSEEYRLRTEILNRDVFGNITKQKVIGRDIVERVSSTIYDSSGRYVVTSINAEGHQTTLDFDTLSKAMNAPNYAEDANKVKVDFQYSKLGRKQGRSTANGEESRTTYQWCSGIHGEVSISYNSCPTDSVYVKISESLGKPDSFEFFDREGRTVQIRSSNLTGETVLQTTQFDSKGRVEWQSQPYINGETIYKTSYEYDALSRIEKVTKPDQGIWQTTYGNFTETQISPSTGRQNVITKNALGQLVESKDIVNNDGISEVSSTFGYDHFGNQVSIDGPIAGESDKIVTEFGDKGYFKTYTIDPDKGRWDYKFDQLGQLIWQKNANQQEVVRDYDLIGRNTLTTYYQSNENSIIVKNVVTTFDNSARGDSGESAVGVSSQIDTVSDIGYGYFYDDLGRVESKSYTIDGALYYESFEFDDIGRLSIHRDASGNGTENYFNDFGYNFAIKDLDTGVVYWEANEADQFGNVTNYSLHNQKMTAGNLYYANTGLASSTWALGASQITNVDYQWDKLGNLKNRTNTLQNAIEEFQYDDLNRLRFTSMNGLQTTEIRYANNGNIEYKNGKYYCYDDSQVHALIDILSTDNCESAGQSFYYDLNGNMLGGEGRTIDYSEFDKAEVITQGNNNVSFLYGPDNNRVKRTEINESGEITTYYVGNVEFVEKNGVFTVRRQIGGVVEVSEIVGNNGSRAVNYTYLFKDHLGSLVATANHLGKNVQQLSFDAWGKRRTSNWANLDGTPSNAYGFLGKSNSLIQPLSINRGFTGHEHIDSVGIIHMNGRIYDPALGRFLQADPFIQYPSNIQNLNRYSYLMNNPLNATDPSGYFSKSLIDSTNVAIGLLVIDPSGTLSTAYITLQAAKATASFVEAYQVWQGGGGSHSEIIASGVNAALAIYGAYSAISELGNVETDLKTPDGAVSNESRMNIKDKIDAKITKSNKDLEGKVFKTRKKALIAYKKSTLKWTNELDVEIAVGVEKVKVGDETLFKLGKIRTSYHSGEVSFGKWGKSTVAVAHNHPGKVYTNQKLSYDDIQWALGSNRMNKPIDIYMLDPYGEIHHFDVSEYLTYYSLGVRKTAILRRMSCFTITSEGHCSWVTQQYR